MGSEKEEALVVMARAVDWGLFEDTNESYNLRDLYKNRG